MQTYWPRAEYTRARPAVHFVGLSHGYREGPPSKLYHEVHWTARFLPDDLDDIALAGLLIEMMFFYLARLLAALPLRSKRLAIGRLPGRRPRRTRALAQLRERKGGPCVSTVSIVCGATGTAEAGASRSVVATGICRDLRAVAPSQHRIHYR